MSPRIGWIEEGAKGQPAELFESAPDSIIPATAVSRRALQRWR